MKKFRFILLIALIFLLAGTVFAAAKPSPYAIKVNRIWNTVTVYKADETGQYTIPVKAMICSTAREGYITPLGEYRLEGHRSTWRLMLDGTYGQYATQFFGHYLFHSICYEDNAHDAMKREAYNNLGTAASMGCVRLETADAKWIFDNCPGGTPVTIYDDFSSPGPLGKPARTVTYIPEDLHTGWDPTDPAEGNPWHTAEITEIELSENEVSLLAGEAASLRVTYTPETALVSWTSSDESVAKVENGKVVALSAGEAVITVAGHKGLSAQCTVTVSEELLPFEDLQPGIWYYTDVRNAVAQGLLQGMGNGRFAPDTTMTRAMVVQVLYQMAGKPEVNSPATFSDVADGSWYADAVAWAAENGVVNGLSEERFAPDAPMTRQELATVLWRYAGSPGSEISLRSFADASAVAPFANKGLRWAVEQGILQGSNNQLLPAKAVSRVEAAVILLRYEQ